MDPLTLISIAAVLFGIFLRFTRRKTIESLGNLAGRRGWRFASQPVELPPLPHGAPFGQGFNRQVGNYVSGEHRGRRFAAFEYFFVPGTGRRKHLEPYTVVTVATPNPAPLLDVSLEPDLERELRLDAVLVEDDDFRERFRVLAEDHRFAFDVLPPETQSWMLADERAKVFPLRYDGDLVVSWEAAILDINRMLAMLDYLCDHLDRTPETAWSATEPR
jgi:hypothetical protein